MTAPQTGVGLQEPYGRASMIIPAVLQAKSPAIKVFSTMDILSYDILSRLLSELI